MRTPDPKVTSMARLHCPDCNLDVVTDPAGRCPEGHVVAATDRPAPADASDSDHVEPAAGAGGALVGDDELLAALEALGDDPPPAHAAEPALADLDLPELDADLLQSAPVAVATATDEHEDIRATLAALGVEAAFDHNSVGNGDHRAGATGRTSTPAAVVADAAPDDDVAGAEVTSPQPAVEQPERPERRIDVGNFTAKGLRVGGGGGRRWSLRGR